MSEEISVLVNRRESMLMLILGDRNPLPAFVNDVEVIFCFEAKSHFEYTIRMYSLGGGGRIDAAKDIAGDIYAQRYWFRIPDMTNQAAFEWMGNVAPEGFYPDEVICKLSFGSALLGRLTMEETSAAFLARVPAEDGTILRMTMNDGPIDTLPEGATPTGITERIDDAIGQVLDTAAKTASGFENQTATGALDRELDGVIGGMKEKVKFPLDWSGMEGGFKPGELSMFVGKSPRPLLGLLLGKMRFNASLEMPESPTTKLYDPLVQARLIEALRAATPDEAAMAEWQEAFDKMTPEEKAAHISDDTVNYLYPNRMPPTLCEEIVPEKDTSPEMEALFQNYLENQEVLQVAHVSLMLKMRADHARARNGETPILRKWTKEEIVAMLKDEQSQEFVRDLNLYLRDPGIQQ